MWSFGPSAHFVSTSTISLAVKWFAYGYWQGVGSDSSSILIAVGTNNYGSGTTFAHDQAWARMINEIGQWFQDNGYTAHTEVRGASDVELQWSGFSAASSWFSGYSSVYRYFLYDYGDANGCPLSGTGSSPRNCCTGWNQDNVRYVAWGASPSIPFPEIYATSGANAKQWQQLSLYSYLAYGSRMGIVGPFTESKACVQRPPCDGIDNTPSQAWSQLWTNLNNDLRTAESLFYSSDIKWE